MPLNQDNQDKRFAICKLRNITFFHNFFFHFQCRFMTLQTRKVKIILLHNIVIQFNNSSKIRGHFIIIIIIQVFKNPHRKKVFWMYFKHFFDNTTSLNSGQTCDRLPPCHLQQVQRDQVPGVPRVANWGLQESRCDGANAGVGPQEKMPFAWSWIFWRFWRRDFTQKNWTWCGIFAARSYLNY